MWLRQTDIVFAAEGRGTPGSLRSRASWISGGLILQAVGTGGVAAYVWFTVRHQDIGGHVTAATIRLAWHSEVHTRPGLADRKLTFTHEQCSATPGGRPPGAVGELR